VTVDQHNRQISQLEHQIERLWCQVKEKDGQIQNLQQLCASNQQSLQDLTQQYQQLVDLQNQLGRRRRRSSYSSRSGRHSSRRPVYSRSVVHHLIRQRFPDWSIHDLQFCGQGSSFCSYALNQEYIIRCAKHRDSIRRLRWEERLLPQLQPQMPVAIPQFQHLGYMDNGLPFCAYPMISGEPFEEKHYRQLPNEQRNRVVQQMVDFLKTLHGFPVTEAISYAIPYREFEGMPVPDTQQFAQKKIYPHLTLDHQEQCQHWFDFYRENKTDFSYQPALIHGDLQPRHILFNPEKGLIAGIIDFEDIRVSDPAEDLYYLQETYGDDFGQRLLKSYGLTTSDNFHYRFRFRRLIEITHHILEGLEDNRRREVDHRFDELREFLGRPLLAP